MMIVQNELTPAQRYAFIECVIHERKLTDVAHETGKCVSTIQCNRYGAIAKVKRFAQYI